MKRKRSILISSALGVLLGALLACGGNGGSDDITQAENDIRVGTKVVRCGLDVVDPARVAEISAALDAAKSSRKLSSKLSRGVGSISVPVLIHVIASDESEAGGNVNDSVLEAQIAILNQAFAGAYGGSASAFTFNVIGITRTVSPYLASMTLGSQAELDAKSALRQGGANVLNLFVANPREGLLGWAQFPFDYESAPVLDGVVIGFQTLPGSGFTPYDKGVTAVHEVGHWLGLFHTFQGECSDENDTISDTPAEQRPAYGCPVGRNTCGAAGDDAVHNYMNYSDDTCLFEFSPEQIERVDLVAEIYRGL